MFLADAIQTRRTVSSMEAARSLGPVQPALPSCPPESDADNTLRTVEDICNSFFVDSAVESRYDNALGEPAENQALSLQMRRRINRYVTMDQQPLHKQNEELPRKINEGTLMN